MREIDKAFLAIFKDLKIIRNKIDPGTDENPKYTCYIGNKMVGYRKLTQMVLRYQDEIIKMLIEENQEN